MIQQASNFNHPMKAFSSPFYGTYFTSLGAPGIGGIYVVKAVARGKCLGGGGGGGGLMH